MRDKRRNRSAGLVNLTVLSNETESKEMREESTSYAGTWCSIGRMRVGGTLPLYTEIAVQLAKAAGAGVHRLSI